MNEYSHMLGIRSEGDFEPGAPIRCVIWDNCDPTWGVGSMAAWSLSKEDAINSYREARKRLGAPQWIHEPLPWGEGEYEVWMDDGNVRKIVVCPYNSHMFTDCTHTLQNVSCDRSKIRAWRLLHP